MTTDITNLHPTNNDSAPISPKNSRFWLIATALGGLSGLITFIVIGPEGPRDEKPSSAPAALVAPAAEPPLDSIREGELDDIVTGAEEEEHVEALFEPSSKAEGSQLEPEPALGDAGFYVQVASFKKEGDAQAIAKKLKDEGLQAHTHAEAGSTWHRVRLGPFDTRAEAETARFELDVTRRRMAYVTPRSNGKYHVQVGSFSTREQAEPVAKKLAEQGHVTKISRIRMAGKRWHCVRIGPFDTYDEAIGYQKLVRDVPGSKTRVIPFAPMKN